YEWIAAIAPGHDRVWDCGTGSGQAAIGLTRHFRSIIATDPSASQITNAAPHPQIEYHVASAEESGLADRSVDAIAIAQAIHWFDHVRFYAEARRGLKPTGIIAAWGYVLPDIVAEIDRIVADYNDRLLADYWSPRIRPLHDRYHTLLWLFEAIIAPEFAVETQWSLADLIGHLGSWSGTQAYREAHGTDPIDLIRVELVQAWGDIEQHEVRWPLFMRVGRND
ncbi:MAG TPA: methyltransferase domain-containing protein, partial [Anaerolineae bacterium]|nr:methyltransferase domain-containing protein [Anaerolineae bacterium]